MLPGEGQLSAGSYELVEFLRQEAERIARFTARVVTADLPVGGTGTRRRLRLVYEEQILELARHLDLYGDEGPRLYGESQRRYAATRLSQGVNLRDSLDERALLHDSIVEIWSMRHDSFSPEMIRLLTSAFAEATAQIGDVYLTYQRAESAAFQEAALLETIVHHLNEAIFVFERDGVVSYTTPIIETLLGYPPRLFVGNRFDKNSGLVERLDIRDRVGAPIAPDDLVNNVAFRTRAPQHVEGMRIRRADGTDAVVEAHASPVFDEEQELRGVVMTLRDRSDLYRQTEALEEAFRDRREMHARLLARSRLEAVGSLAGSAAHALNNQLNVIALRLRRLQEVPGAAEEVEEIERSVREITHLVGRLQELEAAPRLGEPGPMDAAKVVVEALAMVRPEFDGRQVDVHATLGEMDLVMGDPEPLLTLLVALLAGARDACPVGSAVDLETGMEDDQAVIRITDHGPPLSEREMNQLFEPLAGATEDRSLSLSSGRAAVARWGGAVEAESSEAWGNRFTIRLQLAAAATEEERKVEKPRAAPAGRARLVLVVDDDPDNAAMLADLIEGAEGEALTAATGTEALEDAARSKPDAALVDLLLPDMKGWEVVRRLREELPDLRIAVVSGLAVGREERERGEADEYFRKPVDSDEVLHFLGL